MIIFDNVSKLYGDNVGVQDIDITINQGDFVFLVGASGAGKSTFVKLILKEIEADKGKIYFDDFDVTNLSNRMIPILRRKIGIVFQDFRLLPDKTAYENVAFAMEVVHKKNRQIKQRVPQILSLVGISSKEKSFPNELSAGEQQRVAIARALVNNPDVLIADEPTGNLDPDTAWEIMKLLDTINKRGTTVVMVTHAKDIVDRMEKRVIAIENGIIIRDEASGVYGEDDGVTHNTVVFEPLTDSEEEESSQGEVFGDSPETTSLKESKKSSTNLFDELFKNESHMTTEERIAERRRRREENRRQLEMQEEDLKSRKTFEIKLDTPEEAEADEESGLLNVFFDDEQERIGESVEKTDDTDNVLFSSDDKKDEGKKDVAVNKGLGISEDENIRFYNAKREKSAVLSKKNNNSKRQKKTNSSSKAGKGEDDV